MIGNTDWNLSLRHNIKLIDQGDGKSPIPIPYDFDYSGLVNAKYASPHPSLPIKNTRQRLFQWRGSNKASLEPSIQVFLDKKDELYAMLYGCLLIDDDSREDIIAYITAFYNEIEVEDPITSLTKK
jgi:hypothetical protein